MTNVEKGEENSSPNDLLNNFRGKTVPSISDGFDQVFILYRFVGSDRRLAGLQVHHLIGARGNTASPASSR